MALSNQQFEQLRAKLKAQQAPQQPVEQPSFFKKAVGAVGGFAKDVLKSFGGSAITTGLGAVLGPIDPTGQIRKKLPEKIKVKGLGDVRIRRSSEPFKAVGQFGEDILNLAPGGTFTAPIKRAAGRVAPKLVNRIIKPLAKEFRFGKNPGRAIAEEGIIANNVEQLGSAVARKKQEVGFQIGQAVSDPAISSRILNLKNVVNPIKKEITSLGKVGKTQQTTINRLNDVLNDIENITDVVDGKVTSIGKRNLTSLAPQEAHDLRRLVGDLTIWEGSASDKPVNAALKKVYTNINKKLESVVPELKGLSTRYSNLITAESAARRAIAREQKNAFLGLGGKLSTIGAGLATVIGTGGVTVPAVAATASAATLSKLMGSPAFKTRIAKMLANLGREERAALFEKLPLFRAAIIQAFGNQFTE